MNLHAFFVRPRFIWELWTCLHHGPSTQRSRAQNEPRSAARTAYDASAPRIKESRATHRRALPANYATIERWGKPEESKHADVQRQKRLLGWGTNVQRREETHRDVERHRLWLMIRHPLTNYGHRSTRRSNRREVAENVEKVPIDRHALQMSKRAASLAEVRLHDDIWLKRAAESTLALSRTTSKRSDFSVVLG